MKPHVSLKSKFELNTLLGLAFISALVCTQAACESHSPSDDDAFSAVDSQRGHEQCPGVEELASDENITVKGTLLRCDRDTYTASCNENADAEVVYAYTVPTFGIYEIRVASTDFMPLFYVLNAWESSELRCDADQQEVSSGRIELAAGTELRLGVQALGGNALGEFELKIQYLGQPWE